MTIQKRMKLCIVVMLSTMGKKYKVIVRWNDLVLFWGIDENIVICRTGRREITLQIMHLFCVYFITKWFFSIRTISGYIALIVVL